MIEVITLSNPLHKHYLQDFVDQSNLPTFRYFQKRSVEQALKTHILTLLDIEDNKVRGYAHIDFDTEDKRYFLGICVLPLYQKKGIGSLLIESLLQFADNLKINLYLSVDKENVIARNLYEKYGFTLCDERETFDFFQRLINEPKPQEEKE